MYEIACEDFVHYLIVKWRITDKKIFHDKFLDCLVEGMSAKIFVDTWVRSWYDKWKQRVKLILKEEDWTSDKEQVTRMVRRGSSMLGAGAITRFKEPIIEQLINSGEIACVNILAEQLIKAEVGRMNAKPRSTKQEIHFVNHLMKKLRGYIGVRGPLVFLKVHKEYFRQFE